MLTVSVWGGHIIVCFHVVAVGSAAIKGKAVFPVDILEVSCMPGGWAVWQSVYDTDGESFSAIIGRRAGRRQHALGICGESGPAGSLGAAGRV